MRKRASTIKLQIKRYSPVDGEFFLVSKPDGSLFAKTYNLKDATLAAASFDMLHALKNLGNSMAEGWVSPSEPDSYENAMAIAKRAYLKATTILPVEG